MNKEAYLGVSLFLLRVLLIGKVTFFCGNYRSVTDRSSLKEGTENLYVNVATKAHGRVRDAI